MDQTHDVLRRLDTLERKMDEVKDVQSRTEEWRAHQEAQHRQNLRVLYAILAGIVLLLVERTAGFTGWWHP